MAYRDEHRCHLCGEETTQTCPSCGNGVCEPHTLVGLSQGLGGAELRSVKAVSKRIGADICQQCLEEELQRNSGPYVAVYRDSNPVQVQMLAEALEDDGFDVRSIGSQNASLLGAGQHIFEQRIEVPEPQAEEAMAQLAALLGAGAEVGPDDDDGNGGDGDGDGDGGDDGGDDGGNDGGDERPPGEGAALSPRRRSLAIGLAFIFPGASHFYAGRPFFAIWLTVSFFLGALRAMAATATAQGVWAVDILPMVGAVLLDVVGGQFVVTATNKGIRRPVWIQFIEGLIVATLLVGASVAAHLR